MTLLTTIGTFNITTAAAGNTVVITGIGFTPKAIILWWSGRTEAINSVGAATYNRGVGFATSPSDRRCRDTMSANGGTASVAKALHCNTGCIASILAAGTLDGVGDLQSMDANGFTIVITRAFSINLSVSYLALGGSDLTNVTTFQYINPVANGNFDVTALGFQPDCIFLTSTSTTSAPTATPAITADALFSFGAAVSATKRFSFVWGADDAAATMLTKGYNIGTEVIGRLSNTISGTLERCDFVGFLSNGFRLNMLDFNSATYVHGLALKGGQYTVGKLITRTDTVTDIVVNGFGFSPNAAMFVSANRAESVADTPTNTDQWSMGVCTSPSNRVAQAVQDENGTANAEVSTAIEFDEVYANISTSDVIQGLMDIKSMDSDGFTCIMDDADPGAAFVGYVAFGSVPVAPTTKAFLDFGTGLGEYYEERPRPKDTTPRVNPTKSERLQREDEEILIL